MTEHKYVHRFFELFNNRDLEGIKNVLSDDAEFYFPKTKPLMGSDRIARFFSILFRQFPELLFEIQRVISEGNFSAVHWTNRGVSKNGELYENEGVTIVELKDGRICYMSDFFKDTGKF